MACVWVALCATVLATTFAGAPVLAITQAAPPHLDLRTVDWRAVLTNDPALKHPEVPMAEGVTDYGPYVQATDDAMGYAMIEAIEYGDVSGDGQDEAVIQLFSGGTAGNLGVLVYSVNAKDQPVLAAAVAGYKIYGRPDNGRLMVQQPVYAGWEANCCASGYNISSYQLRGRAPRFSLARLSSRNAGYFESKPMTVEQYYQYIANKDYRAAYNFLSPRFRRTQSFSRWQAELASTKAITVEGAGGGPNGAVSVLVTSRKETLDADVDITTHEGMTWQLVWSNAAKQWLLDRVTATELADDFGAIRGQLAYPSEGIPALTVFAKNTATGEVISVTTVADEGSYLLWGPAGTYEVFAYVQAGEETPSGAYTQFVVCGGSQTCTDHALVPVTIAAGQLTDNINISDWYAPAGTVPPKP